MLIPEMKQAFQGPLIPPETRHEICPLARTVLVALSVCLLVGCSASPALRPAERTSIYNTVAHYHFELSNKIVGDQHWPVIFVSPNLSTSLDPANQRWDGDPTPPELLPLLQDLAPRVAFAALETVIQQDKMNAVREGGIWLGFGTIQVDGKQVHLAVEHFVNGLHAAGYEYRLARQGNRWIVLEASLRWIA